MPKAGRCSLGGTTLTGGSGNLIGTVLGVLLFAFIVRQRGVPRRRRP